jgi:ribosomal protein L7/L12
MLEKRIARFGLGNTLLNENSLVVGVVYSGQSHNVAINIESDTLAKSEKKLIARIINGVLNTVYSETMLTDTLKSKGKIPAIKLHREYTLGANSLKKDKKIIDKLEERLNEQL